MTRSVRRTHVGLFVCAALAIAALTSVVAYDPEHVARARQSRQCAGCDLTGAALAGAELAGGNFKGADFSSALLYGADLSRANLEGANFAGANLSSAKLNGARGANLAGATTNESTICPGGQNGPCS